MNPIHRDPLTQEERELAARLSRIGPQGEPPAALDARILSAAHAALAATPVRHRRWPAVLGVAATLALAVGISWQMRPRPEGTPVLEEGPAAAAREMARPDGAAAETAAAMPPSASDAESEARMIATRPQPQPQDAPSIPTRASAPAPQEPPIIVESFEAAAEEAPMALAAPAPPATPAPPPPAPPPPPTSRAAPAPVAATMSASATSDRAATTSAAKAVSRHAGSQPTAADVFEAEAAPRIGDRAAHEVPFEEDARLDADDWLDRIRVRQAADDVAGARTSLALFRRYYPDRPIPADLAPLAQ